MTDPLLPSRRTLIGLAGATPAVAAVALDSFLEPGQRLAATRGEAVDCTAAFVQALQPGRHVRIPPGAYAVTELSLPNGSGLIGEGGVVLHQLRPDRPAIDCVSDAGTGQLADLLVEGVSLHGHADATVPLVRLAAGGGYAIWRSHFSFFAKDSWRALDVGNGDAANVFECAFEVVAEGVRDIAVKVTGGVYNRYHLFLTQTPQVALDDRSSASEIRVVAENSVIFRGQTNRVIARVEGIAARHSAMPAAIVDQGFGNTFLAAEVNMSATDAGKLDYAFSAFQGSVFVSPQVIGPGAPPHPFTPSAGYPFTVIGGRSRALHRIEAIFDGSGPDRDPRSITFIGEVGDFTREPTRPGTVAVQRVIPTDGAMVRIDPATRVLIVDAPGSLAAIRLLPAEAAPTPDGWMLSVSTTHAVGLLGWPDSPRYARLPQQLMAGERIDLVYLANDDLWLRR